MMKQFLLRRSVAIATITLVLSVGGCSVVQTSYNQGAHLAWWWLDGYMDFNWEQTPHAKHAIGQWFDWHRQDQLPAYAEWLANVRGQIDNPWTATQICQWSEELQTMIAPAFDRAAALAVPVVLQLNEKQLQHLEQRYSKSNNKFRRKYLQPNPETRKKASIKRTVKRIENLYGRIDETQRKLILDSIEASPFNPEAWLTERQRRQQITLSTLRKLITESSDTAQTENTLRELIEHTYRSEMPEYRTYQRQLAAHTCSVIAQMHNSTTIRQRQHASDKLGDWESDLRVLMNVNDKSR